MMLLVGIIDLDVGGGVVLCWMFARSILDNPASLKRRAGLDFVWIGLGGLCWDKYLLDLLEFDSTVLCSTYSAVYCMNKVRDNSELTFELCKQSKRSYHKAAVHDTVLLSCLVLSHLIELGLARLTSLPHSLHLGSNNTMPYHTIATEQKKGKKSAQ